MIVVDTTEDAARELLAEAARRAGPHAELGRPVLAVGHSVVTDLGPETTGVVSLDGDTAVRTVELSTGLLEVTRWRAGVELSRAVG